MHSFSWVEIDEATRYAVLVGDGKGGWINLNGFSSTDTSFTDPLARTGTVQYLVRAFKGTEAVYTVVTVDLSLMA